MVISPHTKTANFLPVSGGRIPPQDLGEGVTIITASHIDMIFNHCGFQSISWCWKAASLPPLQLASTSSVDGNLSAGEVVVVSIPPPGDYENLLVICVLVNSTSVTHSWLSHWGERCFG